MSKDCSIAVLYSENTHESPSEDRTRDLLYRF